MESVQQNTFETMAKDIVGRYYFKDGLKPAINNFGWGVNDIEKQYNITEIKPRGDGTYFAMFQDTVPIVIETTDLSKKDKNNKRWTVAVVTQVVRDDEEVNADLGMGADGANTTYLLGEKKKNKVSAANPFNKIRDALDERAEKRDTARSKSLKKRDERRSDQTIRDRLNAPQNESGDTWRELQERAKTANLSDQAAKTLASVYDKLNKGGQQAINKYLQYLRFDVTSQVATLLGQMIEEVPLQTYQDFKEVGFYTKAGQGGSSDDLFFIKAACGLKQAGEDPRQLFKGGQFRNRKEIERIVSQAVGKNNGGGKIEQKKKELIEMLMSKPMQKSREEAMEAVEKTYSTKSSDEENVRNALGYKPQASIERRNAAGYDGYSMSNNARKAYNSGEMPKSKWTKGKVIEVIAEEEGVQPSDITLLKQWQSYLRQSSWHHTSKFYNVTQFYSVYYLEEDIKITQDIKEQRNLKRQQEEGDQEKRAIESRRKYVLKLLNASKEELRKLQEFNPREDGTVTENNGVFNVRYPYIYDFVLRGEAKVFKDMSDVEKHFRKIEEKIVEKIEEKNVDIERLSVKVEMGRDRERPKANFLIYASKGDREKMYKKYGIAPEKAKPSDSVCTIGFSEKDQKWYGWSHRAIYGFGLGFKVKEGDCEATSGWTEEYLEEHPEQDISVPVGFVCETLEDCKKCAIAFAKSVS